MNIIIIYFSGTGNTALISKHIQQHLERQNHHITLISLEDLDTIKALDLEDKILGFGFPVYKFTYPDIFKKVFPIFEKRSTSSSHPIPYFVFCTYTRFTANSLYDFAQELDETHFSLIATEDFKCPSNGIAALQVEDSYEYQSVMFFEDNITDKLRVFASTIANNVVQFQQQGYTRPIQHAPLNTLRLAIVADIERIRYPQLHIDRAKCSACGLCVRHCPEQNLVKISQHITIIDPFTCLHCLRCMHHCPQHAISFGALTQGPQRYTLKTRNTLFERASSGEKHPYWQDFEQIRRRWRQATIRYWLKHKLTL